MLAFIIWCIVGLIFVAMGIYDYFAETSRPFGFWANAETVEVENVRGYNRALGKLFVAFGIIFIILGLPLLGGQNSPWIILSIVGTMFLAIALMVIYIVVFEPKYRKK